MSLQISNFRLGLGIPLSFPFVPSAFFDSFVNLDKGEFIFLRSANGPLDSLRNSIVEGAIEAGCSHLIMMDTDMTYPIDVITKLLSHKLPVVGALCYRRYPPFDPLMYRGEINNFFTIEDWVNGDLVEVDATGTGCLLCDMEVYYKIKPPWFEFPNNPDPNISGVVGEDIWFCKKLKDAGYKIFVDTEVSAGHLSTLEVTHQTFLLYRAMKEQKIKLTDIDNNNVVK
jgi:hypothetical protein